MKYFLLTLFSILVVGFFYFANEIEAQSPLRCGLNGEACCTGALASRPCQTGLFCSNNICVPDGTTLPPTRGSVTGDPVPEARLPCAQTSDPEFNSLRPYQPAPCGDYDIALFCGNQINIIETHSKTVYGSCVENVRTPEWKVDKPYWIDLSETQLPILGNTELVKNSQYPNDLISDATKLNEYVSWYLNGVNNRAEYGNTKSTDYETVNFSGPLHKLLPQAIAEAQTI